MDACTFSSSESVLAWADKVFCWNGRRSAWWCCVNREPSWRCVNREPLRSGIRPEITKELQRTCTHTRTYLYIDIVAHAHVHCYMDVYTNTHNKETNTHNRHTCTHTQHTHIYTCIYIVYTLLRRVKTHADVFSLFLLHNITSQREGCPYLLHNPASVHYIYHPTKSDPVWFTEQGWQHRVEQ